MSGAAEPQPDESPPPDQPSSPKPPAPEDKAKRHKLQKLDVGAIFDPPEDTPKEERPTYAPPSAGADDHPVITMSEDELASPEISGHDPETSASTHVETSDAAIIIDDPVFIDEPDIEELDPEIEEALDRIGTVRPSPIPPPSSEGIVIGERAASYIPDSMFEAVGGASSASLTEKEVSSPSLNERRRLIVTALSDALGVAFSPRVEKVHIVILEAAEAMFVHGQWVADDDLLRKTLLLILTTLDPAHYSPADPLVMKRKSATLARALNSELRRRGKSKLAGKLERSREHPSGHYAPPKP